MTLLVMEKRKMAESIVQILQLLPYIRKKDYESGIKMKKGNQVRDSAGIQQEEGKSKGMVAKTSNKRREKRR